jgi:hypothetical protein
MIGKQYYKGQPLPNANTYKMPSYYIYDNGYVVKFDRIFVPHRSSTGDLIHVAVWVYYDTHQAGV